jgi:hypothetical protein
MAEKDEKQGEQTFPMVFFLDTNILEQLPETLESGSLSSMIVEAKQANVKVYIPDVVAREWIWHRLDRLINKLSDAEESLNYVGKYLQGIPNFKSPNSSDLVSSVFKIVLGRIKHSGLRVLGPPKVKVRTLTFNAVCQQSPFRSSNKGFKDELVVLSMLKILRKWHYKSVVLISQDDAFTDKSLQDRFDPFRAKLVVVKTLDKARELLKEKIDQAWKQYYTKLYDEVKEIADTMWWNEISEAIIKKVKERGVTLLGITRSSSGEDQIPLGSEVKRIVSIVPLKIDRIDVGDENIETKMRPITLWISTELGVEIEEYWRSPFNLLLRRIKIEETNILPVLGEKRRRVQNITIVVGLDAIAKRLYPNNWIGFQIITIGV